MNYMDEIDSLITTDFDGMMEMECDSPDEMKSYTLDGKET